MYPAVSVLVARKHSGTNVTHAYLARPILMRIVVATASPTEPSNWFATPNSGQIVLMLPVQMKYPHNATMIAEEPTALGHQFVSPHFFHTRPPASCSRKRPTRVPESTVVRMKIASNMIAK